MAPPPSSSPALRYLNLIDRRLRGIRRELPALTRMGQSMAQSLVRGGQIFTPAVAPYWTSEFNHRAGGLMGTRWADYAPTSPNDVAYLALPLRRDWDPAADETLQRLIASPAKLFVNGPPDQLRALGSLKRFAGFTGGATPDEGLHRFGTLTPLAPFAAFEQLVRGWIAAGEMIAACTRAGKMPTIWMSVWLEGAMVRNAYFVRHDNLVEPWHVPVFHDRHHVPPLPAGCVGTAFLDFAQMLHGRLVAQAGALAAAGAWLAEARQQGRRLFVVAVGHSYPRLLDLPKDLTYPLEWGASISDLSRALPANLKKGDVALHLGYAPTPPRDVQGWLKRGVKLVHSSPYGRPAGLRDHPNLLWLDLPWRPGDATVDVPGYSVRILPGSSTAHTMAYFAILCEMAQRMGWT